MVALHSETTVCHVSEDCLTQLPLNWLNLKLDAVVPDHEETSILCFSIVLQPIRAKLDMMVAGPSV